MGSELVMANQERNLGAVLDGKEVCVVVLQKKHSRVGIIRKGTEIDDLYTYLYYCRLLSHY